MNDAKERVKVELKELSNKICKLAEFITSEKFNDLSDRMQWLMKDQLKYMLDYADALRNRLKIWDKTDEELNTLKY